MSDKQLRDLLDHVEHNTEAARHCVVEVEPGHFVVTRTRAQAKFLRGALSVLRAQLIQPDPASSDAAPEAPATPAKRGPGRPRKQTAPTTT